MAVCLNLALSPCAANPKTDRRQIDSLRAHWRPAKMRGAPHAQARMTLMAWRAGANQPVVINVGLYI